MWERGRFRESMRLMPVWMDGVLVMAEMPALARRAAPPPARRLYCRTGSKLRRPRKVSVPAGLEDLLPRSMRSRCFLGPLSAIVAVRTGSLMSEAQQG